MIRRLDHLAVAVVDTDKALEYFRDRLGLRVVAVDTPPEVPVKLTYLDLGNTYLQLIEPLDPDHPVARWLAANGDGLHHLCFGVDDVVADLAALGPPDLPPLPLGSGRGRPAGFMAGDPEHGTRVEFTRFDHAEDVDAAVGYLTTNGEGDHGTGTTT